MQAEVLEGFRLSPQQRHLWLATATGDKYCSQCAIFIDGEMPAERLEGALRVMTRRHESLRTTFRCLTGMDVPIQVLASDAHVHLEVRDLVGSTDIRQVIDQHLRLEARSAFGRERGFAGRYTFLKFSPAQGALLITLSSLYSDAATLATMYAQLAALCAENEIEAAAGEEFVQYADYSEWQNELIEGQDDSTAQKYWQSLSQEATRLRLALAPEEASRATDETISAVVDATLLQRLKAFSTEHGSNLRATVLAALGMLIWRLREQRPSILGVLFEGRQMQGLANALGLFAKYLPIELRIEEDYAFTEVVRRVGDALAQAAASQDYFPPGGVRAAEGVQTPVPSLPIKFEWYTMPGPVHRDRLRFSLLRLCACIDPFELKLTCIESAEAVTCEFHYDPAVYSGAAIARLAERFLTLLADVAATPERTVKLAELLSPSERRQLLEGMERDSPPIPRRLVPARDLRTSGATCARRRRRHLRRGGAHLRGTEQLRQSAGAFAAAVRRRAGCRRRALSRTLLLDAGRTARNLESRRGLCAD